MRTDADHFDRQRPRATAPVVFVLAALAAWVLLPAAQTRGDQPDPELYVPEDALLTGKVLHAFASAEQVVNVVLGDFSLTLDKRVVSGRDAVIWITERRLGQKVLRDIEIYVEGDAKVVEPDGTTTTDKMMLVTLRQQGRLRARVAQQGQGPLESLPVYARAVEERRKATTAPAVQLLPVVLVPQPRTVPAPVTAPSSAPGPARTAPSPTAPTTVPAPRPVVVAPLSQPSPPAPTTDVATVPTTVAAPTTAPARRGVYQPVVWRFDEFSSEEIPDPMNPGKTLRITVARGNVYLAQGDPNREGFMEMRAQAAVIYTAPDPEAPGPVSERAIGVYLENDVIMRRGERTLSGQRAFYDFQTGQAIILEPVLRTIQEQREVPIYVRAREARQLQAREGPEGMRLAGYEWVFRDALVTTSDFYTPFYSIRAKRVYLEDRTPYDETGQPLAPRTYRTKMVNTTFNLGAVPILWWPYNVNEAEQGHTALRRLEVGHNGDFGWGVTTSWYLFRLLGVPTPPGMGGKLEVDVWERGFLIGPKVQYTRENYSGFLVGSYVRDRRGEDDFGTQREDVAAPGDRGRFLFRHKQFLPSDWEAQLETSYLSDRNFLEEYYPGEFWADKEQETLLYGKKQRDNWAFTALAQTRLNDFQTQTESYPDLAAYLVGQSLWDDRLTLYSEGRAGALRWRPDDDSGLDSSPTVGRADTRHEIDAPMAVGPIKLLPFVAGRATYWSDTPEAGEEFRPWGQVGFNATTHIWRIYDQAESRLWDVHKIKHIVTPYGGVFFSGSGTDPNDLYPFTPEVERYLRRQLAGGAIGVRNLFQTKRGPAEERQIADWLRLDVYAAFFDDDDASRLPADGRYYWFRPEYSLPRNSVNADLTWLISDATTFLADFNFDTDTGQLGRVNAGLAVARNDRLRYYIGHRYIRDLQSSLGTYGLTYQINRKYELSLFQEYDYKLEGGHNQSTSITLVRKLPRLYVGLTFTYSRGEDDVGLSISVWPEGIPEARFGSPRMGLRRGYAPEGEQD